MSDKSEGREKEERGTQLMFVFVTGDDGNKILSLDPLTLFTCVIQCIPIIVSAVGPPKN